MQNRIIRKGLVVGIIVLFLGIGLQPAFAIDISYISPSEELDDCGCQIDDNYDIIRVKSLLNRIESLLDRVETCNKLIPILYKENPEVQEKGEELSDEINTFREMNEELRTAISGQDNPIICDILEVMLNRTTKRYKVVYNILNLTYIIFHKIRIIANFIVLIDYLFFSIMIFKVFVIMGLQFELDCVEFPTPLGTKELRQKILLI